MAKTIAELKKARTNAVADLQKQVEKLDQKSFQKDDRFWQPSADKAGSGAAVIRFLPAPPGEDLPWVRTWSHSFQGPTGKWYIENSRTTLGEQDPVSELNTELWNSGDAGKEVARKQKRKLNYISNILVVSDPSAPQNDGKVFLFKYGTKIFEKIKDAMEPSDVDDKEPINPFDFWDGADFKLKFRKVDGFRNYDKSEFKDPAPVSSSEKQLEALWKTCHSLAEFIDPKNFKSYDELEKKLNSVLNGGKVGTSRAASADDDGDEDENLIPARSTTKRPAQEEEEEEVVAPAPKSKAKAKAEEEETPKKAGKGAKAAPKSKKGEDEEEDVLAHFAALAEED